MQVVTVTLKVIKLNSRNYRVFIMSINYNRAFRDQEKIEEIIKEKDLEFMKRREKIRRDELDLLEKFLDLDKKHEEALDTIQRLENDLNQNKLRNRRLNNELEKRLENANSAIKKLADHSAYYENGKKYWQIRLPNQEVYDLLGKK